MRCVAWDLGRFVRVALLAAAAAPLAPAVAVADDIFTSEDACRNAAIGKACQFDGGSGTCQEVDCERMDYSVDPPKRKTERCRDCRPGTPTPDPKAADPKAPDPKAPDPKAPDPKAADPKTSDPKAAPATTSTPRAGCQVSPDETFAASLGLGLLALVIVARRRP